MTLGLRLGSGLGVLISGLRSALRNGLRAGVLAGALRAAGLQRVQLGLQRLQPLQDGRLRLARVRGWG